MQLTGASRCCCRCFLSPQSCSKQLTHTALRCGFVSPQGPPKIYNKRHTAFQCKLTGAQCCCCRCKCITLHYISFTVSPIEEYNHTESTRFLSFSQMGEWGAPVVHGTHKKILTNRYNSCSLFSASRNVVSQFVHILMPTKQSLHHLIRICNDDRYVFICM